MILYHGSNTAIDGIDLNRCRPYKDFGRGFYLTDTLGNRPKGWPQEQRGCSAETPL